MKNSKRILSVILALAVLLVSLPMTFVANAAVPNITETEYPVGKVLWSFNAADVSDVPAGWEASKPTNGAWGDGNTAVSYDSTQQAVKLYAGGTDSVLNMPSIKGDTANYIVEAVVTPSGSSSFGLATNVVVSSTVDTDSDGNKDTESATWVAAYNSTVEEEGYFIRKGKTSISRTKLEGGESYVRPASGQQHTLKMVVLNGNIYSYVNDQLLYLADGSAEGFTDPNTTEEISIGMFATNITVFIHSMKVTEIAEPEEIKIWDGSFDGALPTEDKDGDGEIEINTPEEFAAVMKTKGTFKRTITRVVNQTTEYRWWGVTVHSTTDEVTVDEGFEEYIPYAAEYTEKNPSTTKELSKETFEADGKTYNKITHEITTVYTTTFRIKYELANDIWLNDTRVEGWKDNNPNHWLDPVKKADITADNTFYGIINGNGHVVRGVYVDKVYGEGEITRTEFTHANYSKADVLASGTELTLYEDVYAGLFPVLGKGAAIVGIGMEDSYISVRDSSEPITLAAGGTKDMSLIGGVGLVGTVANSGIFTATIDQCYINDSVVLKGGRTALVGFGNLTTEYVVSNCYANATATMFQGTSGKNAAGNSWDNNSGNRFMLVSGNGSYPTIYSCYTFGNVDNNGTFKKNVAAGKANTNVYFTSWANGDYATQITWNNIVGDAAKTLMPNLDWTKFETVAGARPVLKVFSTHRIGTDGAVWNGSTDSDLATDADGYKLITNASELRYAVTATGKFRLANDIWVNSLQVYTRGGFYLADGAPQTWVETGKFDGTFDGNGKMVYGLFYNTPDAILVDSQSVNSGLIPTISGSSTVKRVGVDQSYMRNHGTGRMGAIVATLDTSGGSTIDSCFAGENVYLRYLTKVGGITGGRDNGSPRYIKNCYSLATIVVDAGNVYGGIAGDGWNTGNLILSNCYAPVPYLVGSGSGAKSTNCYTTEVDVDTTKVASANMMGANALTNMPGLNTDNVYQTTIGYPMLKYFDPNYVEEEEVGAVWNGSIAKDFAGGTGTEADPYIIQKGSQLAKAINEFGLNGSYFKLDRDIYLNDIENMSGAANGWFVSVLQSDIGGGYYAYQNKVVESAMTSTKGAFNGHIDGNGHYIYGLNFKDEASNTAGLLPIMAAGSIKNLGVDYAKLVSGSYKGEEGTSNGALIGRVYQKNVGKVVIDRCFIGENITFGSNGCRSGMIGYATGNTSTNYVAISNSYVLIPAATFSGSKDAALIADTWNTWYTLENCWSVGRPVNPGGTKERASQFYAADTTKMGDYIKNVFSATDDCSGAYEVSGDIRLYKTLAKAQMVGANVFDTMTVNSDGAFLYNIGYPTLKWQGNSVPTEEELLTGLENIATAMPMTEYKVDTNVYIVSGEFATGKEVAINVAFGDKNATFKVAADGTASITCGEISTSKALTLSDTAEYKLASVGNFLLAYVNGEFVGFVDFDSLPGHNLTFTGFDLEKDVICVDLYIPEVTFSGVTFGDVDLQLKDILGNNVGGAKLEANLTESDAINGLGFDVEYGVLVDVSDKVVTELIASSAVIDELVFDGNAMNIEFTGLGTAKQELFFALRGYAKITINEELDYYYYAGDTVVFSPIYEANKLYENENYADEIKATYGASDKFIENYDQEIDFTVFGDYHYNDEQYTSQLSDLKAIFDTAKANNSDFVLSVGDMSNDMVGSKEITNYLLDGKYSFRNTEIEKDHDFDFYNLYGNHELEASNRMTYVNTTLTNADVHWGDGSVGSVAAVTQKYAGQTIGNNDFEKRNELATGSYYWFEKNGIRIIVTNNNFSWNPNHINGEVVGWEHALIGSYGSPLASHNAGRGFDEGAAALANTQTSNLGPTQLAWLEEVLMDAVSEGIPCVIAGHGSYHPTVGGSASGADVRALYRKANSIRKGTVIASLNGHQHTNRQFVMEDVLYLDITTVRNSEWRSVSEPHYTEAHTFTFDLYDDEGNWQSSETRQLNSLSMGKQTWFANDPVHSTVKITANGHVELTGMKSSYMYDVIPEGYKDYAYPGQNSGHWTLGESDFTVTEYAYPAR